MASLVLVLAFGGALATVLAAGTTTRVSVSSTGTQTDGVSGSAAISADGRYVAFESAATNLVPGDTNGEFDVFLRDTVTNTTTRLSVSSSGAQTTNDGSFNPSISADGRYVAFESLASNLVAGDTGRWDIFVRDTVANTTTRVSVSSSGTEGNGASHRPCISADGRYVAFYSDAFTLVPGPITPYYHIYVHDRQMNATTRVDVDSAGTLANDDCYNPFISAEGRFVGFWSTASNLVAGDTGGWADVFVRDTVAGTTVRVSVDSAGTQGNGQSFNPTISGGGRYVAFESLATNLVAGDTNGQRDIFVRDTLASTTARVSVDSSAGQANGESLNSVITPDGRYVTFESNASNLVAGDTNGGDIFVRDTQAATTTRVSVDSAGAQAYGACFSPCISPDGRYVAFESVAGNLVAGDTNGSLDVFVHDASGTPVPTPTGTKIALTKKTAPTGYRAAAVVAAKLMDASNNPLSGKTVRLQRKKSGVWVNVSTMTAVSGQPGTYQGTVTGYPDAGRTYVRVRFAGDSAYSASTSAEWYFLPKVWLGAPGTSPATIYRSRAFSAYFYLKPRHTAGTYPVILQFQRRGSDGVYRTRVTRSAKAYNYSTYTKCLAKLALSERGKWRMRAYHKADSLNASTYSSWKYFTVR